MWNDTLVISVLILLLLVNAAGVFLVALQLPGTWLMLIATALVAWAAAWWEGTRVSEGWITWWTLLLLLVLAILGELFEFIAGAAGASRAGASKRGVVGAVVGGVGGALMGAVALAFIPILGILIGASIGAGVGSILGDMWAGREWRLAWSAGRGAAVGRFWGSILKLTVAVGMWLVVLGAVVWP